MKTYTILLRLEGVEAADKFEAEEQALDMIENNPSALSSLTVHSVESEKEC